MKKIAVLALALTFLVPISTPAQTVSDPQVEELKQTLITLLTQMIAQLQAQIDEILARQTSLENNITQASDPRPILGAVDLLGSPICLENNVRVPLSQSIPLTTFSWETYEGRDNAPLLSSPKIQVTTSRAGPSQFLTLNKWNDSYTISYSSSDLVGSEVVEVSCE